MNDNIVANLRCLPPRTPPQEMSDCGDGSEMSDYEDAGCMNYNIVGNLRCLPPASPEECCSSSSEELGFTTSCSESGDSEDQMNEVVDNVEFSRPSSTELDEVFGNVQFLPPSTPEVQDCSSRTFVSVPTSYLPNLSSYSYQN
uniref:Uncharacterized protein n=1 Tax=Lygus hesperus TaxID=30085 RepID=A0A0K8SLR8_LYGHE